MDVYGLIGRSLAHSYSPLLHRPFGYTYLLQELQAGELAGWLRTTSWNGFNVTHPYKQTILPLLDYVDPLAASIGAVNTVVRRGLQWHGYNTDFHGLQYALAEAGIDLRHKTVLILGSGGTSRTAQALCRHHQAAATVVVSRQGPVTYPLAYRQYRHAQVIIHTTPVGMRTATEPYSALERPIDLSQFPQLEGVMDVVYNPLCTPLVQQAQDLGLACSGGLPMLWAQATAARELFTGETTPRAYHKEFTQQIQNIVLVGMPGCGKTTLGKALASLLGMDFADTDTLLTQSCGQTPAHLLTTRGEAAFRELEARIAQQVGLRTHTVIATGGGLPLRRDNAAALRQNSLVVYLQCPLNVLETTGRPLSLQTPLPQLLHTREPVYRAVAHTVFPIDWTQSEAAYARALAAHLHYNPSTYANPCN